MGLNNTPLSERIHIGIFGRRNAGKSSVINVMTGQNLAIVSDVAGTTTDPVQKARAAALGAFGSAAGRMDERRAVLRQTRADAGNQQRTIK